MHPNIDVIRKVDRDIAKALDGEMERQRSTLEMIASENFADPAVLEAAGSVLTNKYAEGYPGKRYYGGCHFVDIAEQLAIDRAKKLFGAEHANVQPHAGAQANFAVYLAFLKPGDTVLGLNLAHGGHLTHGSPVNVSGIYYHFVPYGVRREDERIDYDQIRDLGKQHSPKMIVAGATAYPRIIDFPKLRQIADDVGALLVVDMAHIAGLVAAGVHPTPVPYADVVTSTTHKTLRGPRSGFILCKEVHAKAINKAVFPGSQGGPLMHIIAAKAVAFKLAGTAAFRKYQQQVVRNAKALADGLTHTGFRLVSGGTDNHLVLVDLRDKNITGKDAEGHLDRVGITVNKNTIPFDPNPPFITSGLRIGTPALTTRGMREREMRQIALWIGETIQSRGESKVERTIAKEISKMASAFPLYAPKKLRQRHR